MKIRNGFVSNSSSSSFVIGVKDELTEELLGRILKVEKGSPYKVIAEDSIDAFMRRAELINLNEYLYEHHDVTDINEINLDYPENKILKKCVDKGFHIYHGTVCDEEYDEMFVVPLEIDYEDDDIIMYKESYY